jgi:hypothetical protein
MPKKSARRTTSSKNHFPWSTLFIAITAIGNMYIFITSLGANQIPLYSFIAAISALLTLLFIEHERKTHKLGKGKLLWSIFFAGITLGFTFLSSGQSGILTYIPVSNIIGLALLVKEKYAYK